MQEEWKDIDGFEGSYQVSNLGRVRSLIRRVDSRIGKDGRRRWRIIPGRILRQSKRPKENGYYLFVALSKNGKYRCLCVHRLVAKKFVPNPEEKSQVNHKDGNKSNNVATNLEWVTPLENTRHAIKTGLRKRTPPKKMVIRSDGTIFESVSSAARFMNGHPQNISKCAKHKVKTAYGYGWEFYNE